MWLPQLLRVYVMTAAMSVSESDLPHAIIAVGLPSRSTPFSTVWICASLGPLTTFEPSEQGTSLRCPIPRRGSLRILKPQVRYSSVQRPRKATKRPSLLEVEIPRGEDVFHDGPKSPCLTLRS